MKYKMQKQYFGICLENFFNEGSPKTEQMAHRWNWWNFIIFSRIVYFLYITKYFMSFLLVIEIDTSLNIFMSIVLTEI